MRNLLRLGFIALTALRFGLDELVLSSFEHRWLRKLGRIVSIGRNLDAPRGERLRLALERLGPIFVKFGQVLSTRRDLLPTDLADELAKLQDSVPPFAARDRGAAGRVGVRTADQRGVCQFRARAGGQRVDRAGAFRSAQGRPRGCGQGVAARHAGGDRQRSGAAGARGGLGRARVAPMASASSRARWWPSSTSTCTRSSTSCARPPTRRSCVAT